MRKSVEIIKRTAGIVLITGVIGISAYIKIKDSGTEILNKDSKLEQKAQEFDSPSDGTKVDNHQKYIRYLETDTSYVIRYSKQDSSYTVQ